MSKSIYKEALEILKNRVSKLHINHKIGNKDIAKLEILDIAKAIETHVTPIFEQALTKLEKAQKQENLLKLYKELAYYRSRVIHKLLDEVANLTDTNTTKEEDIKYILDEANSYGYEDKRIVEEIKKIEELNK